MKEKIADNNTAQTTLATETPNLTPREQEILDLFLDGSSPKDIAYKLNVSYSTVNFHRNNLYLKLGVNSIHELFAKFSLKKPAGSLRKTKTDAKSKYKPFKLGKFSIILKANKPWGWQYRLDPDLIYYENKLKEGDIYKFSCSFISNVDMRHLNVHIADTTDGINDYDYGSWRSLTENNFIQAKIKANIEYSCSALITVYHTASTSSAYANRFTLMTCDKAKTQPTITFTKFEIQKT